jgi:hypothetical protein
MINSFMGFLYLFYYSLFYYFYYFIKVLNEQAGIEKVVSFKTNKIRKKFREPLKLSNKASTVRDRKKVTPIALRSPERSSVKSGYCTPESGVL